MSAVPQPSTGVPDPLDVDALRRAVAGVRGLLLDLDGVVVAKGRAIDGAAAALDRLVDRGIPFTVLTNTSLVSRATLARQGASLGLRIPPARIVSALSATAAWTARTFPGEPLFVVTSDDARVEFDGQRLMSTDEADAPDAEAAAVVIGDSPDGLTYENMNRAFRLVHRGAALVGMHRNPWWITPAGPTLDSGAYVAGLEYATGRTATIVGKPSAGIFREAIDIVRHDLRATGPGAGRVSRHDLLMVGDDIRSDVVAARRTGLRAVLVLTGKHSLEDLAAASARAPGRSGAPARPLVDGVAHSLSAVVAALD